MKVYQYQCERCLFNIDDKERMIKHVLNVHGVTGKFKKGFKTITKYKRVENPIKPIKLKKEHNMTEEINRWKRKYLRDGKQAPTSAKVFTSESGKQYYLKEIGKKNSYKT